MEGLSKKEIKEAVITRGVLGNVKCCLRCLYIDNCKILDRITEDKDLHIFEYISRDSVCQWFNLKGSISHGCWSCRHSRQRLHELENSCGTFYGYVCLYNSGLPVDMKNIASPSCSRHQLRDEFFNRLGPLIHLRI